MSDLFDTEFFNTLDRVTKTADGFGNMLDHFRYNKPEEWKRVIEHLMAISRREFGCEALLGMKLEELIDEYARYMEKE